MLKNERVFRNIIISKPKKAQEKDWDGALLCQQN